MSETIESAYLWHHGNGHDKVYNVRVLLHISPESYQYDYSEVTAEYGARLGVLKTITKLKTTLKSNAKDCFDKLVNEKLKKGYKYVGAETNIAKKELDDKPTNFSPGLERRIDFDL